MMRVVEKAMLMSKLLKAREERKPPLSGMKPEDVWNLAFDVAINVVSEHHA